MQEHHDENDSLARTSMIEAVGIITLVLPTWAMFRRGMKFQNWLHHRGAAIHYVFATSVLAATGLKFASAFEKDVNKELSMPVAAASEESVFDPESWLTWINHWVQGLAPSGIDLRLEVSDVLPYLYFIFAIAMGLITHSVFLAGRRLIPASIAPWLRLKSRPPRKDAFSNAIAAICYGLGFFLLLYTAQSIVLFGSHRWSQTHLVAGKVLLLIWGVIAIRAFWVVFIGIPRWLSVIYGVRLLALYVIGWLLAAIAYGAVDLVVHLQ
jgi:hypothetical protein